MNWLRIFKPAPKRKTITLGHAPVDAGCLMLIDPCYLRDVLFAGNKQVEEWYDRAVVEKIDATINEHWPVLSADDESGGKAEPIGHLFISGAGDGYYPVEGIYADDGTLQELRVRFCE